MEKLDRFQSLVTDFGAMMDFVIVYIMEAHAQEEWALPENKITLSQHKNINDRLEAATLLQDMGSNCPIVVDTFENTGTLKYAAMPESLFVIDDSSKVRFLARGPYCYDPDVLRKWIQNTVNKTK